MRGFIAMAVVVLYGTTVGLAQPMRGIQWQTDPQRAIAIAQQTKRPLLFYVLASSKDRDNDIEHAQERAMADPKVMEWMGRFVPVRLSRSVHRDMLEEIGLRPDANMEMAFVAPDGTKLDKLSTGGVAQADSLAQKLKLVFNFYRQQMFDKELRPILEQADATAAELREPLQRIGEFRIVGADTYVAKLLDRKGLDKQTTQQCYGVLAALSTKASVEKLLACSAEGDPAVAKALAECTPVAAEMMLDKLVTEDGYVRLDIYKVVTRICNIKGRKSDRWWERAKEPLLEKELDRVKGLVSEAAKRWKEQYE